MDRAWWHKSMIWERYVKLRSLYVNRLNILTPCWTTCPLIYWRPSFHIRHIQSSEQTNISSLSMCILAENVLLLVHYSILSHKEIPILTWFLQLFWWKNDTRSCKNQILVGFPFGVNHLVPTLCLTSWTTARALCSFMFLALHIWHRSALHSKLQTRE